MPKEIKPLDPTLRTVWEEAKGKVKEAQATLLAAEVAIFESVKDNLPEKGTTHFEGGMKIVTGLTEKWDQKILAEAAEAWKKAGINAPFPFKQEYKPEGKSITYIRENNPDYYNIISPALTVSPKKPSFSLGEEKTEE